jgi:N-acetylglucosaminyl-diphospho-decaprenol L-rhamnosyltransferase
MTHVTVVTITHGRHDHLARQHHTLALGRRRPDAYVVVAMDDLHVEPTTVDGLPRAVQHLGRTETGALPLAAARNAGVVAAADIGAEVVVLLDVDCLAGDDLVAAYEDAVVRRPDVVWSGPVTYLPPPPAAGYPGDPRELASWDDPHPARPHPAPGELIEGADPDLFWSLSFATTPAAWTRIGGFCEDFTGYGGEDTDFARSVLAAGTDLGWVGGARAYHQHHPVSSPPVEHLDDILRNGRIFATRWGHWPMTGWLHAFEQQGLVRRDGDGWARTDHRTSTSTREHAS